MAFSLEDIREWQQESKPKEEEYDEMTESSRRYCKFKEGLEKEFKDSLMVDAKYLGKRKEDDNE